MAVDERLGYPKAYEKMCRGGDVGPYNHGPPSTFFPYPFLETESSKIAEVDHIFPVINPRARPTTPNPKIFLDFLWKQLNHLGNAGFDPAVIRVDPYGNVLYYYADSASPLAWDIDHWFPLTRGGLTVPSNLRLLQQQVCKKKHNNLEFLVPWWDFQLGISVNQFLSIFASSNSDFRHRGLYFLFKRGEHEELNDAKNAESFCLPKRYLESSVEVGLAPAAIVWSVTDSPNDSSALRPLDYNQQTRLPASAATAKEIKVKPSTLKENESPDFVTNPYLAIAAARNSLKQRDESQRIKAEAKKLDGEVNEMRRQNDEEKLTIDELELELINQRRRAEKRRRLAEEQCSYRNTLEKMIRDAMHQSVMYKEQVRLNQAATMLLKARLEAQKVMCDESEKELRRKSKKRDELEKQLRPDLEQARKRSRIDDALREKKLWKPSRREMRMFLEREKKVFTPEADSMLKKDYEHGETEPGLQEVGGEELWFSVSRDADSEEDEESSGREPRQGNIERWLQTLLQNHNPHEELARGIENENEETSNDIFRNFGLKCPKKDFNHIDKRAETVKIKDSNMTRGKEEVFKGSGTGKALRRISSSPSLISGMKKGKGHIPDSCR